MIAVTAKHFRKQVLECADPVLVAFWAAWSAPCKGQLGALEQLSLQRPALPVCTVSADEQFALAVRWRVDVLPTLMLFQAGRPVARAEGVFDLPQLTALVDGWLATAPPV